MNITQQSLEKLKAHWAIQAIGNDKVEDAFNLADKLIVKNAVGRQIQFDFSSTLVNPNDNLLERIAMAYELVAIEGLDALLSPTSDDSASREQCIAAAYQAFEFYRLLTIPDNNEQRIFHILHLSALAYCGQRSVDLYRWLNENQDKLNIPDINVDWDIRILYKLFHCWVRLFRHKDWKSINEINFLVNQLRKEQKEHETVFFADSDNVINRAKALRLVSLYHWAKATEIQAGYMLQGEPVAIAQLLDKHFESAIEAAIASTDAQLEILLRWLQAAARQMTESSIWWVARRINSRVTKFVNQVTRVNALFELMPPQKIAVQEQGLLDVAATAVVVDMPTSGGKTLLAQFKILQALNQFSDSEEGCWIAYVAPTKALVSQITRRLRKDFGPIGVKVEQLTGAIDIDTFEEDILTQQDKAKSFDVLVATPEKLQLVIRNKKVPRPLVLVVMDEAHNIEDKQRGLRIELLLATIKGECDRANFLLLMPFVEKAETLARWLAHDRNAGRAISLSTTAWKPNERIVGMFSAVEVEGRRGDWRLQYETLTTTQKTIHLTGKHFVGEVRPIKIAKSEAKTTLQTVAMAKIMSERGTSIAIANNIPHVWSMARKVAKDMPTLQSIPDEITLVQKFIQAEVGADFELIEMLSKGIGVHHTGLSDEIRALIEWLAEEGKLKILCATTTIAQGINFPVSSVFLATYKYPYGSEMSPREFWNLAGRAGRMNHESVGVVGIAVGSRSNEIIDYVKRATNELVSRLIQMLEELEKVGELNELNNKIYSPDWEDFRCYVAHLWSEKKNLEAVLSETEQLLRNTLGYSVLESDSQNKKKAQQLLDTTRQYAQSLSDKTGFVTLADMTGFSPEGISKAITEINQLEKKLTINDWRPDSLFGEKSGMSDLFGIMLKVPQLQRNLEEITSHGERNSQIADITKAWVSGQNIEEIAKKFFNSDDNTLSITNACKAIYRTLVNNGTWGFSALSKLGIDFDKISDEDRRNINLLPAMVYHGVKTEEAVLLRMNALPRSIAESFGEILKENLSKESYSVQEVRQFLKMADSSKWNKASKNYSSILTGSEYRKIWGILSGEDIN